MNNLRSRKDFKTLQAAFIKNFRTLLDTKGLLNKELAQEIEVTPATVSRYLNGMRAPDLEYVYRIANHFGVSMDWLLGLTDVRSDDLTPEIRTVAELYSFATEEDQVVIKTVLRKYKDKAIIKHC